MKKALITLGTVAVMAMPLMSFAAATTTPAVMGNGDPNLVTQVWGLNGYQTPKVTCNLWGSLGNVCFDISGTSYFKAVNAPHKGIVTLKSVWTPFGTNFAYNN